MSSQRIQLTVEELLALGKKQSTCMHIDPALLDPAPCASQAGISSAAMFGKRGMRAQSAGRPNSARDLSVEQYAALFEKYYGQGSLMDQFLSKSAAESDAALVATLDKEIKTRAGRETRAKYLTARLAGKYGVQVAGITGPPPAAPPVLGLTMVHTSGMGARDAADAHTTQKIMELATTMAEADRAKERQAREVERRGNDIRQHLAARAAATRPNSAAFKSVTREQTQRTGSKFIVAGKDSPPPGYYDIRYEYFNKPQPNTRLVQPSYGAEIKAHMASRAAEREAEQNSSDSQAKQAAQVTPDRSTSPDQGRASMSGRGGKQERPALFKDAHYVHPRKLRLEGTSSFKAIARPSPCHETTASHLHGKYYRDDIDALPQKSKHLVMPFDKQPPRPKPGTSAETPEALGPGAYIGTDNLPLSWTGKHVRAGHKGIRNAPDFGKMSARPGTAPPMPQPEPVADVGTEEAQAALQALFSADLNPSDLVSIGGLQQMAGVEAGYHGTKARPGSAVPSSASSRPFSAAVYQRGLRPHSAAVASTRAAHVVGVATSGKPLSGVPGQEQAPSQGVQWLGQDDVQRYTSTGLRKNIPGGTMAKATRAQEIQGLRINSVGSVVPPASAPLEKIRPSQAADVMYDVPYEGHHGPIQGHAHRSPSWSLPPNRAAQSKQWVSSAALYYL